MRDDVRGLLFFQIIFLFVGLKVTQREYEVFGMPHSTLLSYHTKIFAFNVKAVTMVRCQRKKNYLILIFFPFINIVVVFDSCCLSDVK